MISSKTGEAVPKDEIVKGYEFSKGQYVLFSPEELKAMEEDATHTIDIAEFVPAEQVGRAYLEKIYFLGPDKGGRGLIVFYLRRSANRVGRRSLSTPRAGNSTWCWFARWKRD